SLPQNVIFDPDFSDVVQQRGPAQALPLFFRIAELVGDLQAEGGHPGRVPVRVRVARINGAGERLDGSEVRVFQRLGLFLQANRHQVEDLAQVADLVRGSGGGALGQVAGGNRPHGAGPSANRRG